MTKFKQGNIPWNKGRKLGYIPEMAFKVGNKIRLGSKQTTEVIKKISEAKKGQLPWIMGKHHSEDSKEKIRLAHLGKKHSIEQIKNILRRRDKSSLEIKFENIVNKLGLPYIFVGNGKILVARKVPDFIDKNGKKIAIEVYYRKHKQMCRGDVEIWKAERAKIFNQQGWKVVFFDETEVNEETIKQKIMQNGY